ncbi:MAG: hypothetical protein LIP09_12540 [Bacteroidales bacterium]|nr:hypothetical protein [Bacteroidales bacterium]
MEFDEQAAIDYIRTKLPANSREQFDDDEILNVIDIIWDYYEDNGFLSMELEDGPDELDMEDLKKYVKKMIAKDRNSPLTFDDVDRIVDAEVDYEESIEED